MPKTSMSPLKSNPVTQDGYTLAVEAWDLNDESVVRVRGEAGQEFLLPLSLMPALSRYGSSLVHASSVMRDDAYRQTNFPAGEQGRLVGIPDHPNTFALPDADLTDEATPLLVWRRESALGEQHQDAGWVLTLSGASTVTIGFARWDDPVGVASLIDSMGDPESLITVAGIVDPGTTARLTSRMAAVRLRQARSLPRVDLPKMRKILTDAGLSGAADNSRYNAGRMRLLAVKVADTKVPVAVAINAPIAPAWTQPLTAEDEALPYNLKSTKQEEYRKAAREVWQTRARTAILAAGWRLLELPKPVLGWGQRSQETIWATRVDVETWASLSAAAAAEASRLEMVRGAAI